MTAEPNTIYKFIVLYMLDNVPFSLSGAQIGDFVLQKGYTDYLTLQSTFGELSENGFIAINRTHGKTLYTISEEGRKALSFFPTGISEELKKDILDYLTENRIDLRESNESLSDYTKLASGEYRVSGWITDGNEELLRVTFTVPTEASAQHICSNWKVKSQEIYEFITGTLF